MIKLEVALTISVVLLLYYTYFQVISDVMRRGMVHNTPNERIAELRTKYHVNIRTFQKNTTHWGFAWFKTVYLNENLFKKKKKTLDWVFHHEHYHLLKQHKLKTLLARLLFSLMPLMMVWAPWPYYFFAAMAWAYFMHYIRNEFENQANAHANRMTTDPNKMEVYIED